MPVESPAELFELSGGTISAVGVVSWMNGEPGPDGQGSLAMGITLKDGSRRILILGQGAELVDPSQESVIEKQQMAHGAPES